MVEVVPAYIRKIKCPGHFLIPPQVDVYLREPDEALKGVSNSVAQHYKIRKDRRVRDRFGNYVIDWKKIYALEKAGIVKQPWVTASFAIENIYDPIGLLCLQCDKRCMEGKGKINTYTIKRLHG